MKTLKDYDAEYEASGRTIDRTVWIYSRWLQDNGLQGFQSKGYLKVFEEAERTDGALSAIIAQGYKLMLYAFV